MDAIAEVDSNIQISDPEAATVMRMQIAAQAYANTLTPKTAAQEAGISLPEFKRWLEHPTFQVLVATLVKQRMERLKISGDNIMLQLQEVVELAKKKGNTKDAILALRTMAEMIGELNKKEKGSKGGGSVTMNFGVRPEVTTVVEAEAE